MDLDDNKQVHHTKCPLHSVIEENSLDLLSNRLYGSTIERLEYSGMAFRQTLLEDIAVGVITVISVIPRIAQRGLSHQ